MPASTRSHRFFPALVVLFAAAPAPAEVLGPEQEARIPPTGGTVQAEVKRAREDLPFQGVAPFAGRNLKPATDKVQVEFGLESQVVPLDVVLGSNRAQLIDLGVSQACAGSTLANCTTQARSDANQALAVLGGIPDSSWPAIQAAANNPQSLVAQLKALGITDPAEIRAVEQYLATMPASQRSAAVSIARRAGSEDLATVRLEPFLRVNLPKLVELRLGVPMGVGVTAGSGSSFEMGNVNVDVKLGWNFPGRIADFGVAVGLATYLPTGTAQPSPSLMADLFQAPKHLKQYLTLAPYVVVGTDLHWVSFQGSAEIVSQNRVRGSAGADAVMYFRYGLGMVALPRFPLSILAELQGLEGMMNASAYRALFFVGGLNLNLWNYHLGLAVQVPVVDRAASDMGTYNGYDVGNLARYTVLARTSLQF